MFGVVFAAAVAVSLPDDPSAARLAVHLAEEGFELVPARANAASRLLVSTSSATFALEAVGARVVRSAIEAEPRAVAELELFHRAVLALRDAGTGTVAEDATRLVVIREPRLLSTEVRGRLIFAILEAGFGVTRTATRAATSLCAEGSNIGIADPNAPCTPNAPLDQLRALLPQEKTAIMVTTPIVPVPEQRWWFGLRGGGGGAVTSAIDGAAFAGGAAGLGDFGGRVDVIFAFASREDVSALELEALAGPTWEKKLTPTIRAGLGIRAGVHIHRFDVVRSTSGGRTDFVADLPLLLAFALPPLELELQVTPGLAHRDRRHERDGEVLWSRGAARVLVTLGAAFFFGRETRAPLESVEERALSP